MHSYKMSKSDYSVLLISQIKLLDFILVHARYILMYLHSFPQLEVVGPGGPPDGHGDDHH